MTEMNHIVNGSSATRGELPKSTSDNPKKRSIVITIEFIEKLKNNGHSLPKFVHNRPCHRLDIYGWSRGRYIENSDYDDLINAKLKVKKLSLLGRGKWTTCRCPQKSAKMGEQIDDIKDEEITHLEEVHVRSTFQISACALLDLISRSPKLRVLRFFGQISRSDHYHPFRCKRFLSDLETVFWPYCDRKSKSLLSTLLKRNENTHTFYSNGDVTFDLLGADALPNLRHLSICLNDDWNCKPGNPKKAYEYLSNTVYLSHAKKIEALEIRTFPLNLDEESDQPTRQKIERLFENFKMTFWDQVSKLPKLKYLAIYGSWDLEKICREIAKNAIQVELLKLNLDPPSVSKAREMEEDCPVLSMAEAVRNLKMLSQLRSLHYICHDKLGNIDRQTAIAFKELTDLIWNLELKVCFTNEVDELITNIIRRGNQVGKTYKILLHVEAKNRLDASYLIESVLKFNSSTSLKSKLASLAESASIERFGKSSYSNFQVWGLEQIANTRDTTMFQRLQADWNKYEKVFAQGHDFAESVSDLSV